MSAYTPFALDEKSTNTNQHLAYVFMERLQSSFIPWVKCLCSSYAVITGMYRLQLRSAVTKVRHPGGRAHFRPLFFQRDAMMRCSRRWRVSRFTHGPAELKNPSVSAEFEKEAEGKGIKLILEILLAI